MIVPFNRPAFGKAFGSPFGKAFGEPRGFNPANFGDLRLDLNSFKDVTGPSLPLVEGWADQSSLGNNAAKTIDARRPTLNATGINGRPSLTFTTAGGGGTEKELAIPTDISLAISQSFAVYYVVKCTSFAGFPTIFGKDGDIFRFLFNTDGAVRSKVTYGGPILEDKQSLLTTTLNTNGVVEIHYDINNLISYTFNGTPIGFIAITNSPPLATSVLSMFIGQGGGNTEWFNGEIGRILLYASLPGNPQRNAIIGGLGDQFGISVASV